METALQKLPENQAKVWGLEHSLVYTSGLKTESAHILNHEIQVVPARRGGSVTLHNEGQLVIYFAFPLSTVEGGLERFVRVLESTLAEVLLGLGVDCNFRPGASGIFTAGGKVAFIGLGLKRGFIYHGVSVNLTNNLNDFRAINSCGLTLEMTSVQKLTGRSIPAEVFFEKFSSVFNLKLTKQTPSAFRDEALRGNNLEDWRTGFKRGWLAFHERRFWEAHELWEIYWHEMPPGGLRIFFHAMIQVAMAYYKLYTAPNFTGALSLLTKALEKLTVVREIVLLENQNEFIAALEKQLQQLQKAAAVGEIDSAEQALPDIFAWQVP